MPNKRSKNHARTNLNLKKRTNPGKSNSSTNPNRKIEKMKGGSGLRTAETIRRLNMYREKPDLKKMNEHKEGPSRIEPDRKWFGNVRTVDQKELDKFIVEKEIAKKDPYAFLINKNKIDLSIFAKSSKFQKNKLTDVEPFSDTFGPKSKRIKPKFMLDSIEDLAQRAIELDKKYDHVTDSNRADLKNSIHNDPKYNIDKRLEAGQSRRIWEELYKVIDSSDVLCMILDARDPEGTRCYHVEKHLENNCKFKHLIYVLNKVDLVPTSVTAHWVKILSAKHPTITFRADLNNAFGRESLMNLFRQFDNFHKDKKTISIGFVGYPNVGKSSVINSLAKKSACKSAPIPGETKHWQYVALTKRIFLIDCPGIVYSSDNDTDIDIIRKGVVRAERLEDADYYVEYLLRDVDKSIINEAYGIKNFKDAEDLLTQLAIKTGKLLKHNEPDIKTAGKMFIYDWQRGQIRHYKCPPVIEEGENKNENENK